ncbi:cytochrome P450 [Rhodoferax sp.]|uniref:cytochrome P450 n=1 Tax=Rhodoferax sp. TaxID=50421 RepID=UPI00374D3A07
MPPIHALAAATDPDPYPYYAGLVAGPPLLWDAQLQLWIAARAAVVEEVFRHPHCRVRPPADAVPKALVGSSAGALFGQLVRMNDGEQHQRPKLALQQALAAVAADDVQRCAQQAVQALGLGAADVSALQAASHSLPSYAVAGLLGFDAAAWPDLAVWIADFVACLSPLSTVAQLDQASLAAQALLLRFKDLVQQAPRSDGSLLTRVQQEAAAVGWDQADAVLANLVGLMAQTYDATAGLIGNSIVALRQQPGLADLVREQPAQVAALVQEVSRFDPPVQNTRRWVAEAATIAGTAVQPGQAILLVLAAASRDPAVNAQPDAFDMQRVAPRVFGFGHGAHTCPGQALACDIASAAVQALLAQQPGLETSPLAWRYRPSLNGRIPLFFHPTSQENP